MIIIYTINKSKKRYADVGRTQAKTASPNTEFVDWTGPSANPNKVVSIWTNPSSKMSLGRTLNDDVMNRCHPEKAIGRLIQLRASTSFANCCSWVIYFRNICALGCLLLIKICIQVWKCILCICINFDTFLLLLRRN